MNGDKANRLINGTYYTAEDATEIRGPEYLTVMASGDGLTAQTDLKEMVESHLGDGWTLAGGVSVSGSNPSFVTLCQAMTRTAEPAAVPAYVARNPPKRSAYADRHLSDMREVGDYNPSLDFRRYEPSVN